MAGAVGAGVPDSPLASLEEAAMALDGDTLEAGLRTALLDRGFVGFAETVAAPLLRRLGEGWHAGTVTVAQEHLATATLRRVLESTREQVGEIDRPVAVVATLEGERHEAGALMVATAVTLAGWRVAYLGASLPIDDVVEAARSTGASAVCVSGTYAGNGNVGLATGLRRLRNALPSEVAVYAGGPATESSRERLEQVGVLCPPDLPSLRLALRQQAGNADDPGAEA
jgi:methylmalonyl-CoA mutase cobalamin-binding subunit